MYSFYILLVMIILAVIVGVIEYRRHQRNVNAIPVRVHINGTRGKSSVTRLIGAGLRAGGKKTYTKVTGTFPRLILDDGTETYIHRKSSANIIEQLSIVKYAAENNADVLVMECMALQPQYQTITEKKMVRSTVSVMTNVRMDHVDVMGHTLPEIASVLGRTIPTNQHLFTAEYEHPELLEPIAKKRNTEMHVLNGENISEEVMKGFSYIEHKDNVALALNICEHLGVDRETALKGMYSATPDEGALRRFYIDAFGKSIFFYNAFAANDPDSTIMVWNKIRDDIGFKGKRIVLLNTRQDRLDRAKQLASMVASKISYQCDYLILMGQSTEVVAMMTTIYKFPSSKVVNLGWVTPEKVFEKVLELTDESSSIVAIGNMGGRGADTASYFENRSIKKHD